MKKRKDGRYCKQVMYGYKDDGIRKIKTVYGKTLKEVELKALAIQNDLNAGKRLDCKDYTLAEWSKEWLKIYKNNVAHNTMRRYEGIINNHIIPNIGHIKLSKLCPMDIQIVINKILAENHPVTAKQFKLTIKQIVKQAIIEGFITRDITTNLQKIKSNEPEKKPLSQFEMNCIKKADLTEKERLFIDIMYYTGIRRGEALALKLTNIDLKNRVIHITNSLDISDNTAILKEPKSKAGYRDIPIPDKLFSELRSYMGGRKTQLLFTAQNGGYVTRSSYRRMWESIVKKTKAVADAELSLTSISAERAINFTPHTFRHTYATNLYYSGVDIKSAQYLLGHSTLDMTLKVYTHLDIERAQADSKKKLNAFFDGTNAI